MHFNFVPIILPADQEHLIEFLTSASWPFHVNSQLDRGLVEKFIEEDLFSGPDVAAFWIRRPDSLTVGLLRIFDLDDVDDGSPMFDLRVLPDFQGQGIAQQAVQWMNNYLFQTYPQLERIEGTTRADNLAMQKTFVRCGYVKEGQMRKNWRGPDGHRFDTVMYGILREDWCSLQAEEQS